MSLTKKYLKTKPVCKVTFRVTKEAAQNGKKISLLGDFNDWKTKGAEMQTLKDGSFKKTIELEKDREYQYRYLIDGKIWENDWEADKYVNSEFPTIENSVVVV